MFSISDKMLHFLKILGILGRIAVDDGKVGWVHLVLMGILKNRLCSQHLGRKSKPIVRTFSPFILEEVHGMK